MLKLCLVLYHKILFLIRYFHMIKNNNELFNILLFQIIQKTNYFIIIILKEYIT